MQVPGAPRGRAIGRCWPGISRVGMENGITLESQVCRMNRFVVHTTEEFGTDAFEPICCFLRTGFVLLAELCC